MYLEHFGLSEPPFRITPHTDFFFDGANRGATLDALIYAIAHDEGIVKVSGEVGSGKTMLCRVLMERLPENITIIYLANPSLTRDDILYAIAEELQLNVAQSARTSTVLRALHDHLIKSYSEGRQVVVLIDEAHAMPVETLEEIRLLSNLETNRNKLLQLVLFGQPELNDILARPDMRQLKERITHNFGLEPLVRDDINNYLDFRMRAAGYRGPSVFSAKALKMIAQSSLGLTRRINILADKALLAAFSSGSHQIGPKEITAAIGDCEFSKATYGGRATRTAPTKWITGVLGIGTLASVIGLLSLWRTDAPLPTISTPSVATATGTVGAVPTAPAINPPIEVTAPSAPPVSTEASRPTPNTRPTPPFIEPEPAVGAPPSTKHRLGPLTLDRLETGHVWQKSLADDRWFIQILATDITRHGEIESLLRKLSSNKTELNQIHVYHSTLSGKPRYGVTYGNYPTKEAATAAIRRLPQVLGTHQPYPRQAVRLR